MSVRAAVAAVVVCVLGVLYGGSGVAEATHFAYGHLSWAQDTQYNDGSNYKVRLYWELAFRRSFGWSPSNPVVGSGPIGGNTFSFSGSGYNPGSFNIAMVCASVNIPEDWFVATYSVDIYFPYTANPVTVVHESGDRLSILEENNRDKKWRIRTVVDLSKGTNSPRSTSVPRLYARAGQALSFFIPSSSFNGLTNTYALAPVSDSQLTQARPCGMLSCGCASGCNCEANNYYRYTEPVTGPQSFLPSTKPKYGPRSKCACTQCVGSDDGFCGRCLKVTNAGFVTWSPDYPGLYAVQFKIVSVNSALQPQNSAPLDFIISVLPPCDACPTVTVTAPTAPMIVYVGLETRFDVRATLTNGLSGYQVTVANTPLPTGATITPGCTEGTGSQTATRCTVTVRWTPSLGQLGTFICFQGTAQDYGTGTNRPGPNVNSFGQSCVNLPLGVAALIYLSGIVRDFKPDFPDMAWNKAQNYARPSANFVADDLNSAGDPVFVPSLAPLVTGFNKWYTDDASVNKAQVLSITLTNATQTDPNLYSYQSTAFYPINCALWDATVPSCDPTVNYNRYFTWAVHTYTTYNEGQTFTFRSSDDLWLFINGKIVPGWNLGGVHGELEYTVVMDNLRLPPPTGLGLTPGQTYRADMFFAHRGASSTPSLQVQFPAAALCNSLSFPQSVIAIPMGGFTGANVAMTGVARIASGVLQPVQSTNTGPTGGTAWYSVGGVPQLIKLGNGFSTTFTFKGTDTTTASGVPAQSCEGFAFVIQNQSPTAFGGDAGNLNYAPIAKSLAVEFDGYQQTYLNDPPYQHISVHSLFDAPNSADENVAKLGINVFDPQLLLGICNGTSTSEPQTVTIQYLPGQINDALPAGTPAYGWLRVFMNANLVPTTQAQIDSVKFNARIGTAAYVGFTSAVSGPPVPITATIHISSWSMVVVPTEPSRCDMAVFPTNPLTAGVQGYAKVQARDACNNKIRIGGEASAISVLITPDRGSGPAVDATVTDNSDGTYNVAYTPFIATTYSMLVRWASTEGPRLVQPSESNPFPFSVASAGTSHLTSRLIYSQVLPASRINNAPLSGAGTTQGVQLLIVDHTTSFTRSRATYDLTVAAERTAFLAAFNAAATGNIVAFSVYNPGTGLAGPANPGNVFRTAACTTCAWSGTDINAAFFTPIGADGIAVGGFYSSCCQQAMQYAVVGVKGGAAGSAQQHFHARFAQAERCQMTTAEPFFRYCVRATSGSSLAIGGIQSQVLTTVGPNLVMFANAFSMTNFTIQARDIYNNTISSSSDAFKVSFSPPLSNDSFWGDTSNDVWKATYDPLTTDPGYYNFAFMARRSGVYQMFVNLLPGDGATPILGSPFTVTVRSGPASGETTTALGTGLSQARAGVPAQFQLNLMDIGGNPVVTAQGDVITGYVTSPTGAQTPLTGMDLWVGPGPMTLQYNVTRATVGTERYTLTILINGSPLRAVEGARITVTPNLVDGRKCGTNLLPSGQLTAGVLSSFTIYSRDTFGNDRTGPLDDGAFTVTFAPNDNLAAAVISYGPAPGTYSVSFTPRVASSHVIEVFYSGVSIGGLVRGGGPAVNPITVQFAPGPPSKRSLVDPTTRSPATATCAGAFCVTASDAAPTLAGRGYNFDARDIYDNARPAGADTAAFGAACSGPVACSDTATPLFALVSGNRYAMRWVSKVAGNYSVGVTLGGEQILNSPMTVIVNPDVSAPTFTLPLGTAITQGATEDTDATFQLQPRDRFENNQLPGVAHTFTYTLNGGSPVACTSAGAQTSLYNCLYHVPLGANQRYTIAVYLGGVLCFTRQPLASATGAASFARPDTLPLANVLTGVPASFTVRDQDSSGTSVPYDGVTVMTARVVKAGGNPNYVYESNAGNYVQVSPVGQGSPLYTVLLNLNPKAPGLNAVAGTYAVYLYRNSLETGPFALTVEPGPFVVGTSTIPALTQGTAGVPQSLAITLRDQFSQLITQAARYTPRLLIVTQPGVSNFTVAGVWSAATSQFVYTYTLTAADPSAQPPTDRVSAQVFVTPSSTSFDTTVTLVTVPNVARPENCTAVGIIPISLPNNGLTAATVATGANFFVFARDYYGNPIDGRTTPLAFTRSFTVGTEPVGLVYAAPLPPDQTAINQYTGDWVPVTAGARQFSIQLNGVEIGTGNPGARVGFEASPFDLVVQPGLISAANSRLTSLNGPTLAAGSAITWKLETRDINGNPWQSGNLFAVTATILTPSKQIVVAVVTADPAPGVYVLTVPASSIDPLSALNYPYTATLGQFVVQPAAVTQGPTQTFISTFVGASTVTVVPGAAYAPNTLFVTDRFYEIPIEASHTVRLQLADRYGNLLTAGGPVVRTTVHAGYVPTCAYSASGEASGSPQRDGQSNPGGAFTIPATATDLGNGQYTAAVSSTGQGFFYVNATVNGMPIDCLTATRQTLQVSAGIANGNRTYAVGGPLNPGAANQAGVVLQWDVYVRDRLGNPRVADGRDVISVGVTCAGAPAPDCLPASFPMAAYGLEPDRTKWISAASAAKATIVVTYDNPSTYAAGGAPAGWGDAYHVSVYTNRSDTYALVMAVNGQPIVGSGPGSPAAGYKQLPVAAGPAASWQRLFHVQATAAYPAQFELVTIDRFGNRVVNPQGYTYTAQFKGLNGLGYTFYGTPVPVAATGNTEMRFTASWPGYYEVLVTLVSEQVGFQGPSDRPAFFLNVSEATCGASNASFPLRCPVNRACVAQYSDCSDITPRSVLTDCSTRCASNGACINAPDTAANCPCPAGFTKCAAGGQCANLTNPGAACLQASDCPTDAPHRCLLNGVASGQCRRSAADCPSPRVCPPGFLMCADTVTCALTTDACPPPPVCPAGFGPCPDNSCARAIEDCPTPKTCPTERPVVCPDGSCQSSYLQCPDLYTCFAPNPFRCADGTCRPDFSSCPSSVVCPAGTVLCENGRCAASLAACSAALQCPRSQVRCPSGQCVQNLLFCPSRTSCPADKAVLCSDGSCTASSFLCPPLASCPAGSLTCPDGSCAADLTRCPTPVTCPADMPVLCADGGCRPTVSQCGNTTLCPTGAAVRCPDGSCRASLVDCPTSSSCPSERPIRCFDGVCAVAIDLCANPANYTCDAATQIRCPGGECALALTLCPTHVTCAQGFYRCLDGSCRPNCVDVNGGASSGAALPCPTGQVMCPQSNTGNQCAASLANCPQGVVCPAATPVKCLDASCAAAISECPPPPTEYQDATSFQLCPDGTWATNGDARDACARPPTCPPNAPYKCYDLTCRIAPADCPAPPRCPLDTPYLCPNGNCVDRLWNCKPYGQCDTTAFGGGAYVQCADAGHTCKRDIAECPAILTPTGTNAEVCPYLWTYCKDTSCKEQPGQCTDVACPAYLPHTCPNGLCVANSTLCPGLNGCPANAPVRCWTGLCRASFADCLNDFKLPPVPQCSGTDIACPDGSCQPDGLCPNANGCNAGEIRCLDGRCASYAPGSPINPCLAGADATNTCPGNRPFRCADGFCALSSTNCPPPPADPNAICTPAAPMLCANGDCVQASVQCPLVLPCVEGQEVRCGDGTCRAPGACPCMNCEEGNSCPLIPGTRTRFARCANGLCARDAASCPSSITGCPGTQVKCPNGACAASLAACSAFTVAASNGCPSATPFKCPNGDCKAAATQCLLLNNCPVATPYLCFADGSCRATPDCTGVQTCEQQSKVRCADGKCAATAAGCTAANGCPIATPIRCANGACGSFPAGSGQANACPVVVACENTLDTLCRNGACVAAPAFCPPYKVCESPKVECADFTCVDTVEQCPVGSTCPAASPIQCPNGFCAKTSAQCPATQSTTVAGGSCRAPKVVCFDGSCRANSLECMQWAADARLTAGSEVQVATSVDGVCPGSTALCADGSCAPTKYDCPIVPACDRFSKPLRCWDGSCQNSTAACPAAPAADACAGTRQRCEDGSCRAIGTCIPFDGCPLDTPWQCLNRRCVTAAEAATGGCPITLEDYEHTVALQSTRLTADADLRVQSKGLFDGLVLAATMVNLNHSSLPGLPTDPSIVDPQYVAYGESFDGRLYWPCNTSCKGEVKATRSLSSVAVAAATTIPVAYQDGTVVASVLVPSGALLQQTSNTTYGALANLLVRPVSESRMRVYSNNNVAGRRLDLVYTVLSPAFECLVDGDVVQPFVVNLTYTATIDAAPQVWGQAVGTLPDGRKDALTEYLQNVCLATPQYQPLLDAYIWKCLVFDTAPRQATPVRPAGSNAAPSVVQQTFAGCGRNGTVYAFIFAPPYMAVDVSSFASWVDNNIQWILLVLVGGIVFIVSVVYFGSRLYRYRKKLHNERKEVKTLQNEVDDMEQFGGRVRKDSDVQMVDNPMAVQLKEMQARYDANELKIRQAEAEERAALSAERQEAIRKMEEDRNMMSLELDKLKQQLDDTEALALQKKQQAMESASAAESSAAAIELQSQTKAAAPVVRSEFTAAKPKRRQLSRNID